MKIITQTCATSIGNAIEIKFGIKYKNLNTKKSTSNEINIWIKGKLKHLEDSFVYEI